MRFRHRMCRKVYIKTGPDETSTYWHPIDRRSRNPSALLSTAPVANQREFISGVLHGRVTAEPERTRAEPKPASAKSSQGWATACWIIAKCQLIQSFINQSLHGRVTAEPERAIIAKSQLIQSFIIQSLHVAASTTSVTLHNQSTRDQANELRNRQQLEYRERRRWVQRLFNRRSLTYTKLPSNADSIPNVEG